MEPNVRYQVIGRIQATFNSILPFVSRTGWNSDSRESCAEGIYTLLAISQSEVNSLAKGAGVIGLILMIIILVIIAGALFPTVNDSVTDMTNATHDDYVGADSAGLVGLIPLLYWVLVVVVVIGAVMGAIKFGSLG